jgi:hypothetical protein
MHDEGCVHMSHGFNAFPLACLPTSKIQTVFIENILIKLFSSKSSSCPVFVSVTFMSYLVPTWEIFSSQAWIFFFLLLFPRQDFLTIQSQKKIATGWEPYGCLLMIFETFSNRCLLVSLGISRKFNFPTNLFPPLTQTTGSLGIHSFFCNST